MGTLHIPSTLNSFFIAELKRLPVAGIFTSYGERADVIAYKVYGDVNLDWIIKAYNDVIHPFDDSFATGSVIKFPSLNQIEQLYSTLSAKSRLS